MTQPTPYYSRPWSRRRAIPCDALEMLEAMAEAEARQLDELHMAEERYTSELMEATK